MLISFLRDNLREYGFSILKLRQMPIFSLLKWLYKKPEMDQMLFMLTKQIYCAYCYIIARTFQVKCSFELSKRPVKVDKLGGSKMSVRMLMSVSWIKSYFYTHGVGKTQHLEPMEWVKFKAETVMRESFGVSKPSSL